jgi:cytoskeletal protein CcmA (bactofilin family)
MKGTTVEGNIETFGNVRIEGKIIGNIKSKSKIALGDSSFVEGNITSQNAEIAGEVKGTGRNYRYFNPEIHSPDKGRHYNR